MHSQQSTPAPRLPNRDGALGAPKAGVALDAPKPEALEAPNAGAFEAPKAGAAGVLVAPKAEALEAPNAGAVGAPKAGAAEAPKAGALGAPKAEEPETGSTKSGNICSTEGWRIGSSKGWRIGSAKGDSTKNGSIYSPEACRATNSVKERELPSLMHHTKHQRLASSIHYLRLNILSLHPFSKKNLFLRLLSPRT